ncbi:hypothetical protein [Mucilaginibacter sp. FT3.2]|uniref:hypothetical protein n=1 Tax=Mucilaginibacter sp. FT3.2 TaxID=2723090 RepID=UPI001608F1F3|nr:hypothetical protein [Mucilaginibacter sp. FT3.2]MBB6235221.1 hypothetical protein [Mucilaginibacter sp. FT3.2]
MAIAIYTEAVWAAPRCCPAKSGLPLSRFFNNRYSDYWAIQTVAPKVLPVLSGGLPPGLFYTRLRVSGFQHTARGIADLAILFTDGHQWCPSVRCPITAGVSGCVQKAVYFLTHLRSPVMPLT